MRLAHDFAFDFVEGILRESGLLDGVEIIRQNSEDLSTVIQTEMAQLDRPVAVVTVDRVTNEQHGARVIGTVAVTENVVHNRQDGNFRTALDVAIAAQKALDRHDVHSGDVTHTTPGDGVLEAVCTYEIELLEK